jgi:hypothetical protein
MPSHCDFSLLKQITFTSKKASGWDVRLLSLDASHRDIALLVLTCRESPGPAATASTVSPAAHCFHFRSSRGTGSRARSLFGDDEICFALLHRREVRGARRLDLGSCQ